MTWEPYAYLITFGIVAGALLLLLDRLEKDHDHDDDTNQTREDH